MWLTPLLDMLGAYFFVLFCSLAAAQQSTLLDHQNDRREGSRKIAIVGSGVSGASTAWQLRRLADASAGLPSEITVYEQTATIGGRVQTIKSSTEGVRGYFEAGASHFSPDDWCIRDAIDDVGLSVRGSYYFPSSDH